MNTEGNKSFSKSVPGLQIAWDSTSLGMLKKCPRYYQYTMIYGREGLVENVHIRFGQMYHKALEIFDHHRASGASYDDALFEAFDYSLKATWDPDMKRPWLSDLPEKNRLTLLRAIVWYLEEFREDSMTTITLANGKPAVELSFRFETENRFQSGEQVILCGHLDRLALHNERVYVNDRKTTKSALDEYYFSQFSPDNQVSLYSIAGEIVYNVQCQGVIIDAVQMGATFCRFGRREVTRDKYQKDEWMRDLRYWLSQAEIYATTNYWPQNDKSCFGCGFRPICERSPISREMWLKASYKPRIWDPLSIRGDI